MLYDPLRIFFPAGVMLSLLGFLAGFAGILNAHRLVLSNSAILLFLAAILTWLLGLIASQVASTLIHYHGDETIIVDDAPYDLGQAAIQSGIEMSQIPRILIYVTIGTSLILIVQHTIVRIVRYFHKCPMPEFAANTIDNSLRQWNQP